ncbi:hypothetical protein DL771_007570 [Monosporascus sp. 5C6A]|nr:hypothetical protein DL771_007570 [Monosporascus sp. 5C6A]
MKDPPLPGYIGNHNTIRGQHDGHTKSQVNTADQYPFKGRLGEMLDKPEGTLAKVYAPGGPSIDGFPSHDSATFNFQIPINAPEGDEVVFDRTSLNNSGNREYYMSYAVIIIQNGDAAANRTDLT